MSRFAPCILSEVQLQCDFSSCSSAELASLLFHRRFSSFYLPPAVQSVSKPREDSCGRGSAVAAASLFEHTAAPHRPPARGLIPPHPLRLQLTPPSAQIPSRCVNVARRSGFTPSSSPGKENRFSVPRAQLF